MLSVTKNKLMLAFFGIIHTLCLTACDTNKNSDQSLANAAKENELKRPTLVVQITIDQLRSDFFEDVAGLKSEQEKSSLAINKKTNVVSEKKLDSGFKFLIDNGLYYQNAFYQHTNTLTAVGHSTLATGVSPSVHGIIGNEWYDYNTDEVLYCTHDTDSFLLPKKHKKAGSPKQLLHSTLADQIVKQGGRAISVSVKDRGAIFLAGKNGKAFWFDKNNGNFSSSSYYFSELPEYVTQFNSERIADSYLGKKWKLSKSLQAYRIKEDQREFEVPPGNLGNRFPHQLLEKPGKDFYQSLTVTPFADELTLSFAKRIIKKERLGRSKNVDFIAISLSANDYIGHYFGAFSVEQEDHRLKLDKMLANLIAYLDKEVGLENIVFALSADHGVAPTPEHRASQDLHGDRLKESQLVNELNQMLYNELRIKDAISSIKVPAVNLTKEFLNSNMAKDGLVLEKIRQVISSHQNIEFAHIPSTALADVPLVGSSPKHAIRLANSSYKGRSGQFVISTKPFVNYIVDYSTYVSNHGSAYPYDTHVPLLISHLGTNPNVINALVAPKQLSPSLAGLLDLKWEEHSKTKLLPQLEKLNLNIH